jgi:hypothetical protein
VQEDRQTKSGLQAIRDSLVKMADLVAELDALSTGPEYSGPLRIFFLPLAANGAGASSA